MARQESEREDLLREATALVERIEFAAGDRVESPESTAGNAAFSGKHDGVVVGFRANGAASFFFGSDPVYQFNAAGELRRAYSDGLLIKAERGRLIALERVRCSNAVQLVRHELFGKGQAAFLIELQRRLRQLATALANDGLVLVGQFPPDGFVRERVCAWLASHESIGIAATPRV